MISRSKVQRSRSQGSFELFVLSTVGLCHLRSAAAIRSLHIYLLVYHLSVHFKWFSIYQQKWHQVVYEWYIHTINHNLGGRCITCKYGKLCLESVFHLWKTTFNELELMVEYGLGIPYQFMAPLAFCKEIYWFPFIVYEPEQFGHCHWGPIYFSLCEGAFDCESCHVI